MYAAMTEEQLLPVSPSEDGLFDVTPTSPSVTAAASSATTR